MRGSNPPFFMSDLSFKKREKLRSKKSISALFESGRNVKAFPLRILYSGIDSGSYPALVAISVPKRLFKKAVDRNLLKRRIREAYRHNKSGFYMRLSGLNKQVNMVIQYHHSKIVDYRTMEEALIKGLNTLLHDLEKK